MSIEPISKVAITDKVADNPQMAQVNLEDSPCNAHGSLADRNEESPSRLPRYLN